MKERPRKRDRKKEKQDLPRIKKFEPVRPRTENQQLAIETIRTEIISLVIGTAGTGKTLIAISEALRAVELKLVRKIVLIRPMVAVGESLGYLPGDVLEKVAPYTTPLLYYIDDLMQIKGHALKLIDAGVIEIVPLALIRGRTFDDSIIVMDEAQNTTPEQMQAALTRIGENSSMVIIGDTDQCDLKKSVDSGLDDLLDRLYAHSVAGLVVEFGPEDIQRNEILKQVHKWYE